MRTEALQEMSYHQNSTHMASLLQLIVSVMDTVCSGHGSFPHGIFHHSTDSRMLFCMEVSRVFENEMKVNDLGSVCCFEDLDLGSRI